jgi:hypothetical protein
MQSPGVADLVLFVVFVVLVLDSRRLRTLARSKARGGRPSTSGHGIPPGANPDQVGLPLRQIQMRHHVDWQDGGLAWDGPEILPADQAADTEAPSDPEPSRRLPVIWKPFPALPAAGMTANCPRQATPALTAHRG